MDKLDAMKEFREDEIFELLNQQYANMELQEPKEVRENSIVLIRNIGNEPKREPLKFARIDKIHKSRDNAQRVVTLTYNNVRMNKNGDWIGTPVTVDRSVNDLVLVDNALNDSMLGPKAMITKKNELHQKEKAPNDDDDGINESNTSDDDTVTTTITPVNDSKSTEANENMTTSDTEEPETKEDPEPVTVVNENDDTKEETDAKARRSSRKRVQQMVIETDDIGDCDNENDPDYRS